MFNFLKYCLIWIFDIIMKAGAKLGHQETYRRKKKETISWNL